MSEQEQGCLSIETFSFHSHIHQHHHLGLLNSIIKHAMKMQDTMYRNGRVRTIHWKDILLRKYTWLLGCPFHQFRLFSLTMTPTPARPSHNCVCKFHSPIAMYSVERDTSSDCQQLAKVAQEHDGWSKDGQGNSDADISSAFLGGKEFAAHEAREEVWSGLAVVF